MRWLRRSSKPAIILTDYGRVSDKVHTRRAERARNPEAFASKSGEVQRAARSYEPTKRLDHLAERARVFVEDSRDSPRTFEKKWVSPDTMKAWESLLLAGLVLAGNLVVLAAQGAAIYSYWKGDVKFDNLVLVVCAGFAVFAIQSILGYRFLQTAAEGCRCVVHLIPPEQYRLPFETALVMPATFCLIVTEAFGFVGRDYHNDPMWTLNLCAVLSLIFLQACVSIAWWKKLPFLSCFGLAMTIIAVIELTAALGMIYVG